MSQAASALKSAPSGLQAGPARRRPRTMRLKTMLALFTAAVAAVPVIFTAFVLGSRSFFLDPREPVKAFVRLVDEEWNARASLDAATIQRFARKTGFPTRAVALVSSRGEVHYSSIPSIVPGSVISIRDILAYSRRGQGRPSFNIVRANHDDPDSRVLLYDLEPIAMRQSLLNRSLLFAGAVELVLLLVAGSFTVSIARSFRKAVDALGRDARTVAQGNLDHPVAASGIEEIRSLAESVNLMRLTLKDLLERQSRMLMGVSHDLKTPIALIQGYAEALSDGVAVDERSRKQYLDIIKEKASQLEDLASELIEFLKVGNRESGFSLVLTDPCALGRAVGRRIEEDSRLIGRSFAWGFGESLSPSPDFSFPPVPMNQPLVERALDNLVDNAFRHGGPGCSVLLRMRLDAAGFHYEVIDDGPGIPDSELPYAFDAFWRGSRSRSGEGHGLGLTIVRATAELHGWKAGLRSLPASAPAQDAPSQESAALPSSTTGHGTIASLLIPERASV